MRLCEFATNRLTVPEAVELGSGELTYNLWQKGFLEAFKAEPQNQPMLNFFALKVTDGRALDWYASKTNGKISPVFNRMYALSVFGQIEYEYINFKKGQS